MSFFFLIIILLVIGIIIFLIARKIRSNKSKIDESTQHRVTTIIHELRPKAVQVTRGDYFSADSLAKATGSNLPFTLDPKVNYYENKPAKIYYYPSDRIPQVILDTYGPMEQARIRFEERIYGKPTWPITSNIYEELNWGRPPQPSSGSII